MVTPPTLPATVEPADAVSAPVALLGGRLRTVRELAAATVAKAWHDRVLGLSAEAAFWQLLSLPPLLLGVLGSVGYFGSWTGSDLVGRVQLHLLRLASEVLQPAIVEAVVAPILTEVLQSGRGEVATAGFVLALWAGSSATATFVNTITIAYGQRNLRGPARSRLLALWLYLWGLVLATVAAPLLLLGPDALLRAMPATGRPAASELISLMYWPVLGCIVFAGLSALYHFATPVRLRWRRAAPGAALALVLFLPLSYALQLYVNAVAGRLLVFSTAAAPILALVSFYVLALVVLLGAELNAALEHRWPHGTQRHGPGMLDRIRHRVLRLPPAPAACACRSQSSSPPGGSVS